MGISQPPGGERGGGERRGCVKGAVLGEKCVSMSATQVQRSKILGPK